jgi:hypothetical protein
MMSLNSNNSGKRLNNKRFGWIRRKHSELQTGRTITNETKIKMSLAKKGKKHSKETIQKMILGRTGQKRTNETKLKMSKSMSGKIRTKEHSDNIAKSNIGKKHSKETRRKMSISKQGFIPWNKGTAIKKVDKLKMDLDKLKMEFDSLHNL